MSYDYHMRHRLFYHVFVWVACFGAKMAMAAPLVIVDFVDGATPKASLKSAIGQAKTEVPQLESVTLQNSHALEGFLEKYSDRTIKMVVVIAPDDVESVTRLPGIYPDIKFVFIDMNTPFYANNVQVVQFKENEGLFMLGAIAGMRAEKSVALVSKEPAKTAQIQFAPFIEGLYHVQPKLEVKEVPAFGAGSASDKKMDEAMAQLFNNGASLVYTADDELTEYALAAAKQERKLVIAHDEPAKGDAERLLTYMVKRQDLALLDVVRIYDHGQWRPGMTELGVSGGYIDYALGQDNVDLFPKESIDQIEAIKDYIAQGLLNRLPR